MVSSDVNNQSEKIQYHTIPIYVIGFIVILLLLLITIVGPMYINKLINNNVVSQQLEEVNTKFQTLSAGITFDQKRKRTLLTLRDIILEINSGLSPAVAYEIAEINLDQCDRFQRVDPLLLVALQKVESSFNLKAVSHKGALGLNQIWPPTGRLLSRVANWEYSRKNLLDPKKSTYLAVLYLDLLHVEYDGKEELILADYNGGPKNAYYFKIGSDNCSSETQKYVKNVLEFRSKLRNMMKESI